MGGSDRMKDYVDRSYSDDAEFEDFDDLDYMEDFLEDEEESELDEFSDDYEDDLEDMYADEDDAFSDEVSEVEISFICEDCGHKWTEYISQSDEVNDFIDVACPMCGSSNVTQE